jgi:carbonic anhydrase/acetyltransferase-like protein (isoleucine patch superfamily)
MIGLVHWRRGLRLALLCLIGLLPSLLKRPLYRTLFGYRIGRHVRIGLALIDAREVELGDGTEIGHANAILRVGSLLTGPHAHIGFLNLIRGGTQVRLGSFSTVMRFNVLNAIPDHDCTTAPVSELDLGDGAIVVSGHRIDFTDHVRIGRNTIIGGRNSSLWTHNRQETAPISVGDFCYLGSEVRIAPGASLPRECILGMGAVLVGAVAEPRSLVAGVPARTVRPLTDNDLEHIRRKTRSDIPDDHYEAS